MTITKQRPVCTRPFSWCEIHPDGSVFLCCPAWLKRPVGNLLQQPLQEIWNGSLALEIRKSILNGSFHNCHHKRCPFLSVRRPPVQAVEEISDSPVRQAIRQQLSQLPYLPRELNLCFDHSCNMACPSCRNSLQQADTKQRQTAQRIANLILEQLLPTTRSLTLSGFGDPFGSPTYLNLLRELEQGDSPHLSQLRLHSNGQLLTEMMWRSLPKLSRMVTEVEISLDAATAATYQLNRPGGSFTRLLKNLRFLSTQACQLTLSMVVQQNNWREIPRLLSLATELGARVYLSQLVNWGTFSREEFMSRAVHLPGHPEHADLCAALRHWQDSARVDLGNLSRLPAKCTPGRC